MAIALIADCSKSGVVMTSEVLKDKLTGIRVITTSSGAECLELAKKEKPSIIIVDFDLPDADGPSLVRSLRAFFHGPILMTAFPDNNVKSLAAEDLCFFDDASEWLDKPIDAIKLEAKLDKFLVNNHRVMRRFKVDFPTVVSAKQIGARKSQSMSVDCINISLSGLLLKLENQEKIKKNTALTISLPETLANDVRTESKKTAKTKASATKSPKSKARDKESKKSLTGIAPKGGVKLEVKIAWKEGDLAGVTFKNMSSQQTEKLEKLLRSLANS